MKLVRLLAGGFAPPILAALEVVLVLSVGA